MAKCSNCGANVNKKSSFCPKCGTKVEQQGGTGGKKGVSTVLVIILVALALVLGVGAGIVVAGMSTQKETSGEIASKDTEGNKDNRQEKESVIIVDEETESEPENSSVAESEAEQEEVAKEPETEEIVVEEPSQTESVFEYVYIGDEVRKKESTLYEACNDIYNFIFYPELVEGWYEGEDEAAQILNYSAIHFTKAQPRDIRIIDSRCEGGVIEYIHCGKYEDYNVSYEQDGTYVEGPTAEECYFEYGNVLTISKDYFMNLDAGVYRLNYLVTGELPTPRGGTEFVIVHDEEEEIKNYRIDLMMATQFYSTESKNDVLFYMNGATSPVKSIIVDHVILSEDCYDLTYDGYGIVFHSEFLEQYKDRRYLEALVWTESGLKAEIKVAYLNHAE